MSAAAQLLNSQAEPAGSLSDPDEPTGHPHGVRATARIHATYNGRVTTLRQLRSDGPFHLRRMRTDNNSAKVGIIGAMSAPLGGDRLTIDVTAGNRAALEVTTAAATLALRGPTTAPAHYEVRLAAGEHTSLRWLPQPLISAAGSNLRQTYTIELTATARLLLREEQLLGRTNEEPGHLVSRLLVHRAGRPLVDQQTAYGHPEPGWDGPAILHGHRAVGQLLLVDPNMDTHHAPALFREGSRDGCAVLTPLANGPALLATAVAPNSSALRELLDKALAHALQK
ncbi:urease accessory protein UreD [Streptomyces sp. ISL-22]|uniref:urease accessory protein UreD n=1 Tax=unclassified Streptomyces TaxID=2593676 RepID=UPI001BE81D92|nr:MULTISPECIES: urease accessory protein UreD [unclassified Streptomyces]MBT2424099.1 urease accessory protein UreD [Streptomyces sp. ISL-24]MBT2433795.1 urease accessory protein UreD [Streptomyces sp. ISL-22]